MPRAFQRFLESLLDVSDHHTREVYYLLFDWCHECGIIDDEMMYAIEFEFDFYL